MASVAYGPLIAVSGAGQVFVCGASGTSSGSVATQSGRCRLPLAYWPPSSTPTMSSSGGVLGTFVTRVVNRAFATEKVPPVLLLRAATVVVTEALPTPVGVTVRVCAPALPHADRTTVDGDTVATSSSLDAMSTVTVSPAPSKLQPGSPSPSAPTT